MSARQKNIVIVSNTLWFVHNFKMSLIDALREDGHNIIIVAPKDIYVHKLKSKGIEFYDIKISNKGTNPLQDMKLIYDFYKLYKKLAPDIVMQYTIKPNIYGSIAAGKLGIPVISSIVGLGTVFINDNISSRIARILYKITMKYTTKVFFLNKYDRDLFIESKIVNSEKTDLVPGSGIDTERFKPKKRKPEKERAFNFLFIGRLLKDKGLIEFVKAAEMIITSSHSITNCPKPIFSILGPFYPGNPSAIIKEKMTEWGDKGIVKYLGTNDNVEMIIADADCVVLPSYREGISSVLLEAASMGKPLIACDVPGCKEIIDDGINGYLCEVKSIDSLVKQMNKMLMLSSGERAEMGKRGREKIVNEFDDRIVIEKYKKAIDEILHDSDL